MATTMTAPKKRHAKRKSRAELKRAIEAILRAKFPHDTIDITDGFEGSVHVLVVSRVFDKLPERGRYSYLWKIIKQAEFTESENDSITIVVGVSPREVL
jgi:hypothetical protein